MDNYKIDSHKLIYHIPRLNDWLQDKVISPVYVEISPVNYCNHNCVFCALDYRRGQPRFIQKEALLKVLSEMADSRVKSVMFAGEGEPLLYGFIAEAISAAKKNGLDVALTTNGALLDRALSERILKNLAWLRISLDAANPQTYARLHSCDAAGLGKVMDNISCAVRVRKSRKLSCVIGGQLVLLEQNLTEVGKLAERLRSAGADYLIVKPYSQHPLSRNRISRGISARQYAELKQRLMKIDRPGFQIILRDRAFNSLEAARPYKRCLAAAFWAYLDSAGDIYPCSNFLGKIKYSCGNIHKSGFKEIMISAKRSSLLKIFNCKLSVKSCRPACRMDAINQYLWELKHPRGHENFI